MSALDKIDGSTLPQHIAIIMDGNGRWAANHNKPRIYGHQNAVNSVRSCVEASAELKIPVLTLYAFSTENWQRPKKEVSALMNLFFEFLGKEMDTMLKNNVRFNFLGNRTQLPGFLQERLSLALNSTSKNLPVGSTARELSGLLIIEVLYCMGSAFLGTGPVRTS